MLSISRLRIIADSASDLNTLPRPDHVKPNEFYFDTIFLA